jgi:hypothetical protein
VGYHNSSALKKVNITFNRQDILYPGGGSHSPPQHKNPAFQRDTFAPPHHQAVVDIYSTNLTASMIVNGESGFSPKLKQVYHNKNAAAQGNGFLKKGQNQMNQTARDSTPVKLNHNNQNFPQQLGNKFLVEQNQYQNPKVLKKGGSSSLERLVFDGGEH